MNEPRSEYVPSADEKMKAYDMLSKEEQALSHERAEGKRETEKEEYKFPEGASEENYYGVSVDHELMSISEGLNYDKQKLFDSWYYLLLTGKGKKLFPEWDWEEDKKRIDELLDGKDNASTLEFISHLASNFGAMLGFQAENLKSGDDPAPERYQIKEGNASMKNCDLQNIVIFLTDTSLLRDYERAVKMILFDIDKYIENYC